MAVVSGTTLGVLIANVRVVSLERPRRRRFRSKGVRVAALLFAVLGVYALAAPAAAAIPVR